MEKLLNKRQKFVGVVVGEAMMIEKNLYEHEGYDYERDVKIRLKKRPRTLKNTKRTISGGIRWVTENYIVYENRYRIPVMNIYYNDKLILENEPVYFGNNELRKTFKIGDTINFSAIVEKFNEFNYEKRNGYENLKHYVDEIEFDYEFRNKDYTGIFERENGDTFNMKYEFTKTVYRKNN